MDYNDIEDFSGTGTYQYDPRLKRKPYSALAAAANAKLGATPAAAAAPAAAPAAAAAAAAAAPAAPGAPAPEQAGTMGYGKILNAMNSPGAWEAAMEAGMARSDASAQNMMKLGSPTPVPYGGKKSLAEAASEGLKTGIGMYDYLNSQKAKASALRKYQKVFEDAALEQKFANALSPSRGSGQHSVQGNPDYINDL